MKMNRERYSGGMDMHKLKTFRDERRVSGGVLARRNFSKDL